MAERKRRGAGNGSRKIEDNQSPAEIQKRLRKAETLRKTGFGGMNQEKGNAYVCKTMADVIK